MLDYSYKGQQKKKLPVILIALIVPFLIIFLMFVLNTEDSVTGKHRKEILDRLDQIEKKLQTLEALNRRVERLEEQDRLYNLLEESLTLKMERLEKTLDGINKHIAPNQPEPTQPAKQQTGDGRLVYTVRPGDSLYGIGQRYGLSVQQLRKRNQLQDDETIHPGQQLIIRP